MEQAVIVSAVRTAVGSFGKSLNSVPAVELGVTALQEALRRVNLEPGQVDEVIVGGGGASNPTMLRMLAERLPNARVLRQEDLGYLSDAKEAIAFAILAYEGLHGRPGNLPSCTFARHPAVLGKITPGANYRQLLRSLQDL